MKPPLETGQSNILTINGGSSSIRFGLYQNDEPPMRLVHGIIDRIGQKGSTLSFWDVHDKLQAILPIIASDHRSATHFLLDWLENLPEFQPVLAIGHRVVHGLHHTGPEKVTTELLDELRRIIPYDPDHLPDEIELMEAFRKRHPKLLQMACFDTAFHAGMPRMAMLLPIPRRFEAKGIRRYGFHGLSYSFLMEELAHVAGTNAAQGRVVLAHLGNGASLAAVRGGKSLDTSMGFTPASGLVMGARSGDLDPGVAWYLMQSEHLNPSQFNHLINHDSGLLGISETSSDMRDLLVREHDDIRAAEAVDLFCYQAKKWIGAFAAVLGGIDTLVFAGGMGENCPVIRARICADLGFLGIELDNSQNTENAPVISKFRAQTTVRVMHTDENWMIAKTVRQSLTEHV
jgi:acetate kinase